MEQTERIRKNEEALDELNKVSAELAKALDHAERFSQDFIDFCEYYGSEEWFADYDDKNEGKLPDSLKCGVLSEDLPYDLIVEMRDHAVRMLELAAVIVKDLEGGPGDIKLIDTVAYNIFYDYIRNRKETSGLEDWEVDATYQTEQRRIGEEMDIYRGLSILKEAERTCITLRYMEDLSVDKIADITGMPLGTVKSHLSRGKEKLANFLKQNGYE